MPHHVHRTEPQEHPFVQQAKQYAREAGSSGDNTLINWTLRMLEESLAFGNRKR